jgi:hypothetical protein
MATTEPPELPARIGLARSRARLLAVPVIVGIAGAAAVGVGVLGLPAPGPIVLTILGAAVILGALVGALLLMSVRFEVGESSVSLTWFGGRRTYGLVPGPVTRVQLRGRRRSSLRPRSGALGWGIGPARLRGEEEIELVRLAPTPSAILIPTDRGRLAVAPADEHDLLAALARAAQARQRTEEEEEVAEADEQELEVADAEPSALTGIERALLEERLARERDETARATLAAQAAAAAAADAEAVSVAEAPPAPEPVPAATRPHLELLRSRTGLAFVLLPTIASGATWWVALLAGVAPDPGTDLARLTAIGLVLAGPATSLGALMTLAWWPRLVGVVVAGGVAATIFIGRAFIG